MQCESESYPLIGFNSAGPDLGAAFCRGVQPQNEPNLCVCIVFGHYAGAAPNWTPRASGVGAAFDIDTLQLWFYCNGQWNLFSGGSGVIPAGAMQDAQGNYMLDGQGNYMIAP